MNSMWRNISKTVIAWRTKGTYTRNLIYNHTKQIPVNALAPKIFDQYSALYTTVRQKSKKAQHDFDDDNGDESLSKDSKVVKFNTTSMRTDAILKLALAVARNKIELIFYESKIRVNGKKLMKKSAPVKQGDEIDVIKSVSPKNPDHLYVSRVEILNVTANEDNISVTVRRFKSLLIENYEQDPYKGSSDEN